MHEELKLPIYATGGTAEALRSVYENLGSRVQVQTRETEVTGFDLAPKKRTP
jgi:hypothetical protein